MSSFVAKRALGFLILSLGLFLPGADTPSAAAENTEDRGLVICADPSNLPYSNANLEGFENRIAEILANDLRTKVSYYWISEHKGFLRRSLLGGHCDAVMSVPVGIQPLATTRPFFSSSYVAVMRSNDPRHFSSFDDPWLRDARVGLQLVGNEGATTPPAVALSRRGLNQQITPFQMWAEDDAANPHGRIVNAVAEGDIDIAFVWGPFAGFFAKTKRLDLRIEPVIGDALTEDHPFVFDMAIGVRKSDEKLRDQLQEAIDRRIAEIARLLEGYGVPVLPSPAVAIRKEPPLSENAVTSK